MIWLSEWALPMATLKRLVQRQVDTILPPGMGDRPRFGRPEELEFLNPSVQPFDIAYVGLYILTAAAVGIIIFWRRDVQ
jgi:hypothetical protein